jgi:D-xylose reductase
VQAQGIRITAYSSFGPTSYITLNEESKAVQALLDHADVKKIADKHSVSTGQVLLRWALDREFAVIPKSVHEDRMKGNFDILNIQLDSEDQQLFDSLQTGQRFNDPKDFFGVPIYL